MVWPCTPFVELTGMLSASAPSASRSARVSTASFVVVPVP
jgi:hypothetical protein